MKEKVGVAIITCNRPDFLRGLLNSLIPCHDTIDELVIINDGPPITDFDLSKGEWLNNPENLGVCKSKNKGMQYLLDKGCDYIFVIEDDMIIKNNAVFTAYINAYKRTGIHHFMFAYHGPANKGGISGGDPTPRKIIDYGDIKIALNQHCVGSFCFYTKQSLEETGLMDEEFNKNNFEHVEHSYRLAKNDFSTPYWWWSDLSNSIDYINEQACSEVRSSIRRGTDWQEKILWSARLFEKKHGYMPAWSNAVPDTNITDIVYFLKKIKHES